MGSAIPRALNRGAVASDPGTGCETDKDEYTVLMTGFGPFSPNYPLNPSHLLASSLPSTLPLYPTEPSSPPPDPTTTPSSNPTIRIITYPTAIRVSYSTVASLIPSLYTTTTTTTSSSESSPSDPPSTRSLAPDFVIHMGMAAGRAYYTLETGAWRDGYDRRKTDGGRDVDGQVVRSAVLEGDEDWWEADAAAAAAAAAPAAGAEEDQQGEEDGNEWLGTRVGVENVRKLWAAHVEDADVRLSTAAGRWLCEFIYYRSLRHFRDARHTDVVFLHVPAEVGEVELERGRRVTAGLVRALVEERRNARGVEGGR